MRRPAWSLLRISSRSLPLSQILAPGQLSMPKSSWPFNTRTILNLQQLCSLQPSRRLTCCNWRFYSCWEFWVRNDCVVGFGLYSAICCPSSAHQGLHFLCYCCICCLWLPLLTSLFCPPSSSTPINIATVEAAKAKGTHGCVPLMSLFCVCCLPFKYGPNRKFVYCFVLAVLFNLVSN